jgi:hypothetical protein
LEGARFETSIGSEDGGDAQDIIYKFISNLTNGTRKEDILVATKEPSKGTERSYFAPRVGSAPWNSMVTTFGGGGGVEPSVQVIEMTVWGGPTTQVPGGPLTSAVGKSTVLSVHWEAMSMVEDETEEMERTLSVSGVG